LAGFEPQPRDAKRIARGMREGMRKCPNCGKTNNKHTIREARECQKVMDSRYFYSVQPEKMMEHDARWNARHKL
jgi:hypothetical protein